MINIRRDDSLSIMVCYRDRLAYASWFVIERMVYRDRLAYPSWFVIVRMVYIDRLA